MPKERVYFIDNIGVLLTILIILHHLAITYGAPGAWYYQEGQPGMISILLYAIFTGFYVVWRLIAKDAERDVKLPRNITIVLFALLLGVVTFTVRIWLPMGWTFVPLGLQSPFFPQYIGMFIIGMFACRGNWAGPCQPAPTLHIYFTRPSLCSLHSVYGKLRSSSF